MFVYAFFMQNIILNNNIKNKNRNFLGACDYQSCVCMMSPSFFFFRYSTVRKPQELSPGNILSYLKFVFDYTGCPKTWSDRPINGCLRFIMFSWHKHNHSVCFVDFWSLKVFLSGKSLFIFHIPEKVFSYILGLCLWDLVFVWQCSSL